MNHNSYITVKRAKFKTISGEVNIPYGTKLEVGGNVLLHNGKPVCAVFSDCAYEFFAQNDDGQGLLRGKLIQTIKSTLAKHMNALLVPSDGTMWVDGMDTKEDEHLWDVRQSAGMVFQNPDNQIIGTVVEEDVGFGPENLGVPTEEIWQRVEDSLKAVGMIEYRHHSPNKLSGGQKQRVAIAGVMAMRPKCIVLDEPTAMLDPNGRKEVLRSVMELRKREHITVILITHYMEEVVDADHVFVMDHGHVVMQGTPREIFSQVDTLKHYRLDVPQVTILADELRKRGLDIPAGVLKKEELVEILCRLN